MSTLGDMVVRIRGDNRELDQSIDKSKNKLEGFSKKAGKIGKTAEKVGKKLSTFVTLPILALGAAALKSAADMEVQEAAFTTLLGSAETAKDMLQELTDFSARTPFQLKDLAQSTKTMLSFGIAQEKVMPNLQALGDIAQGDSEKLKSLTLAFSQIQSTGRLMGQDLLQLINAGFNPLQVIGQKTGETMAELKERMSAGAISADEITEAFQMATSEGGMFFGGMEKASQTLTGQISTLKDNVGILGRELVSSLLPIIKNIVSDITNLVKRFQGLDEQTKKNILTFAGVAMAAGPVISAIGKISKALSFLAAHPAVAAFTAISLLVGVIATVAMAEDKKRVEEYTEEIKVLAIEAGVAKDNIAELANELDKTTVLLSALGSLDDFTGLVDTIGEIAEKYGITNIEAAEMIRKNEDLNKKQLEMLDYVSERLVLMDQSNARLADQQALLDDQAEAEAYINKLKEEAVIAAEAATKAEQETADALAEQLRLIREQKYERKMDAYETFIDQQRILNDEIKLGLIAEDDRATILRREIANRKQYIDAIIAEGSISKEQFNGHIEAFQQLQQELNDLIEIKNVEIETDNTLYEIQKRRVEMWDQEAESLETIKVNLKDNTEQYKKLGNTITNYVSPALEAIGKQLVQEQFSWYDVAKAAVESIASVVRSLAEQAAVQSAIAFGTGNIAGGIALATASAAGFVASGLISGLSENIGADQAPATSGSDALEAGTDTRATAAPAAKRDTFVFKFDLDSEPILEKIFPGSLNGDILISQRAIV